MEIYELKYFLAVAQFENVRQASTKIQISSASLSKAIQRLEQELGIKLFFKEGRNIRLTSQGRALQKQAAEIVQLEELTRSQIAKTPTSLKCTLAGPEILLTEFGLELIKKLQVNHEQTVFELHSTSEKTAIASLAQGEAQLGLITGETPQGFESRTLRSVHFHIVVGKGHPLYASAKAKKSIPVDKLLDFSFAAPSSLFLGQVKNLQSTDGWRDDIYPRKIQFTTSCLKMLEKFVTEGRALAYLPDYYANNLAVESVTVSEYKYSFSQKVKLIASEKNRRGWILDLFKGL